MADEEHAHRHPLDPPRELDDRGASLEARVRMKMERGDPLDAEERAFFVLAPADKQIPAEAVRESARLHGGEAPIDAETGRPHDPDAHLGWARGLGRAPGDASKPPRARRPDDAR